MNLPNAVITDGVRTPFQKAFTNFANLSAIDLAKFAVRDLLRKTQLDPNLIEDVIMGQVIPSVATPNLAREVVLALGLPDSIPGFTINRACASSAQAAILAAQAIRCGDSKVLLVGGAESMSNVPIPYNKEVITALTKLSKAKSIPAKIQALTATPFSKLIPQAPDIAESATGKSMGQHAERMAQLAHISREEQDKLALASHKNAYEAVETGRTGPEVCPIYAGKDYQLIDSDNFVRPDTTLEQLAELRPVFDRTYGTLTAGNSSGLTDGASSLLIMEEQTAKDLGYKPLARIKSWANTSLAVEPWLLLGPAYALPKALDKAGLTFNDLDLIDIHEAFAAQTLAVTQKLECPTFGKEELGLAGPVVESFPYDKLNVNGGSIALGHPFGATGGRILLTVSRELQRRGAKYGAVAICAAGGMGTAVILEAI